MKANYYQNIQYLFIFNLLTVTTSQVQSMLRTAINQSVITSHRWTEQLDMITLLPAMLNCSTAKQDSTETTNLFHNKHLL